METSDFSTLKVKEEESQSVIDLVRSLFSQKRTTIVLVAWGSIIGINWTYGSLFGIIFTSQNLTDKEIALIGFAANLSSAVFSNLGTYIKNKFNFENITVIQYLNSFGIAAAIIIELSRFMPVFQSLWLLLLVIIVLRAGFSSFVSLAFIEMEREGIKSLVISACFFWVANVVNLFGMELVDLIPTDTSLLIITLTVAVCVFAVNRAELLRSAPI